jgi:hypothetical protein
MMSRERCIIATVLLLGALICSIAPTAQGEGASITIVTEHGKYYVVPGELVTVEIAGVETVQSASLAGLGTNTPLQFIEANDIWTATFPGPEVEGVYEVDVQYAQAGINGTLSRNIYIEAVALYVLPKEIGVISDSTFNLNIVLLDWTGKPYPETIDCKVTTPKQIKGKRLDGNLELDIKAPSTIISTDMEIIVETEVAATSVMVSVHPFFVNISSSNTIITRPNFSILGPYFTDQEVALSILMPDDAELVKLIYRDMASGDSGWHNASFSEPLSFGEAGVYLLEAVAARDGKSSKAQAYIIVNDRTASLAADEAFPGESVKLEMSSLNSDGMIASAYLVSRDDIASVLSSGPGEIRDQEHYTEATVRNGKAIIQIKTKPNDLEGEYLAIAVLISEEDGDIHYHATAISEFEMTRIQKTWDGGEPNEDPVELLAVLGMFVALPSILMLLAAGWGRK